MQTFFVLIPFFNYFSFSVFEKKWLKMVCRKPFVGLKDFLKQNVFINPPPPPPPSFHSRLSQRTEDICSWSRHNGKCCHTHMPVWLGQCKSLKSDSYIICWRNVFRTQASLYSVRWYFESEEFYRFVPKEAPPARTFPVSGINVDVSRFGVQEGGELPTHSH